MLFRKPSLTLAKTYRHSQVVSVPQGVAMQLARSALGHEERFPPTRLSAGCGFREETIAGMRRNGRDAP